MRQAALMSSGLFGASILVLGAAAAVKIADYQAAKSAEDGALQAVVKGQAALAFESHYNKEFPAKTFGTNLWAAIDYLLFDEGRPGVVIGRGDWLYTDEEFNTYEDAQAHVAAHLQLIDWVREELARRGSVLAVAVIPAKTRIYPEHLGQRLPAAVHRDLYARIEQHLSATQVRHADLLGALQAGKRREAMFLRTDTHWTPAGAEAAAWAIAGLLRSGGLAGGDRRYTTRDVETVEHRGDLFNFLPLEPYFARLMPPAEPLRLRRTEPIDAGSPEGDAALFGDAADPRVALVGTSYSANERWNFTGALQQALGEDVVNYAQQGKGPFVAMLDYLQRKDLPARPARVVVWELPERYFPVAYDLTAYRDLLPAALLPPAPRETGP